MKNSVSMYEELNKKIDKNVSKQYVIELQNSYFYALCASWFQSKHLFGIAKFFKKHSYEENEHAKKFLDFMLDRKIFIISHTFQDKIKSENAKDIFKESYEREKQNSKRLNSIYNLADKIKDFNLQEFLDWFIKEQIEEESTFERILKKFDLLESNALYHIDKELEQTK